MPVDTRRPPARPCVARKPIRRARFGAAAHSPDVTVNPASAATQTRPAPNRRLNHPEAGSAAASASRYALATHCVEDSALPRSWPMTAIPTLTREVSSPVMNAPNVMTAATPHTARGMVTSPAPPACGAVGILAADMVTTYNDDCIKQQRSLQKRGGPL